MLTLHLWARLKAEEKKKKKSGMHVLGEHKTKGMSEKSAGIFSVCVCTSVDRSVTVYAELAHSACLSCVKHVASLPTWQS